MSEDLDRDLVDRWLRHLPAEHVLTRVLGVIALERKRGRRLMITAPPQSMPLPTGPGRSRNR